MPRTMTKEKAVITLREWDENKSLCLTGERLDGNPDEIRITKSVPGDPEFRAKGRYLVDTFHMESDGHGVNTIHSRTESYDDPEKAIDVLNSAGINEFRKCREALEL